MGPQKPLGESHILGPFGVLRGRSCVRGKKGGETFLMFLSFFSLVIFFLSAEPYQ